MVGEEWKKGKRGEEAGGRREGRGRERGEREAKVRGKEKGRRWERKG